MALAVFFDIGWLTTQVELSDKKFHEIQGVSKAVVNKKKKLENIENKKEKIHRSDVGTYQIDEDLNNIEERKEKSLSVLKRDSQSEREVINFTEIDTKISSEIRYIDTVLSNSGSGFAADLSQLKLLRSGTVIKFNFLGHQIDADIKSNELTSVGNRYMEIGLDPRSSISHMTVFFGRKLTRGKIYTPSGSYIFQHNGVSGFYMPIGEYEELKGIAGKLLDQPS